MFEQALRIISGKNTHRIAAHVELKALSVEHDCLIDIFLYYVFHNVYRRTCDSIRPVLFTSIHPCVAHDLSFSHENICYAIGWLGCS